MRSVGQITVALLKPDIASNPLIVKTIERKILDNNFYILKRRLLRWQRVDSESFYHQHKGKFFQRRLVECMTSGPIIAMLLAKDSAIADWRQLMGPTKVYKTRFSDPDTIRGTYGLSDTRNTVHGSDSTRSVEEEAKFFFPGTDLKELLKNFQASDPKIVFDEEKGVHETILQTPAYPTERLHSKLGEKEAWSEYYATSRNNAEWFVDYSQLKDTVDAIVHKNPSYRTILDLGCGTSAMGPALVQTHQNLSAYCLDSSLECLLTLSEKHSDARCTYVVGDACKNLPLSPSSVHLVIDKGTSDAVLRHSNRKERFSKMMKQVFKVLAPDGTIVQITTDPPELRISDLQSVQHDAEVSYEELDSASNVLPVFVYCIKNKNT